MNTRYFIYNTQNHKLREVKSFSRRKARTTATQSIVLAAVLAVSILAGGIAYASGTNSVQGADTAKNPVVSSADLTPTHTDQFAKTLSEPVEVAADMDDSQLGEFYDVPEADTGAKRWMDYRAITSTTSMQYAMQQDAWTDELGFRRYGEDGLYMVAMGTYYSESCGKQFRVTLDNGTELDVILGDIKDDRHTDELHQHREGNVVEFIVDTDVIPELAAAMGDMSYAADEFYGKVASIQEVLV